MVGMDLGKKESQIAIITEAGELIEKRIRTERERLIRIPGFGDHLRPESSQEPLVNSSTARRNEGGSMAG